ncbi:hypothetical protein MBLNU230_g2377t1 [Neophaeotheca triangularis]
MIRPAAGRTCWRYHSLRRQMYSIHDGPRDYSAAVQALNSIQSNFAVVEQIKRSGWASMDQALPEMRTWCRAIGYEPSDFDVLNPIHISGTKGKGSTSSFVSSILAQYLPTKKSIHAERVPTGVGLYTSPHLRFVRERIKINGAPLSEDMFAQSFWAVWDRLEASSLKKPVYFHFLTLMALHTYMKQKVGTAVIECGIGGEYDTTNILVKPSVTGVTSLGMDHVPMLGETIESIAWHKSGIFKEGIPAFTVPQPNGAMKVLHQRAEEKRTSLQVVNEHRSIADLKLGLHGDFQRINASLAIAISANHLQKLGFSGLPTPADPNSTLPAEFNTGLEQVHLGGRCEARPDTRHTNLTWYIDGGHTLESIEQAGRWFAQTVSSNDRRADGSKATRILVFNQQTRDASTLARKLHTTLASALNDDRPFQHAIFCPNTTYKDAGYKPDLVSMNTNKADVDALKVQKELAGTWDQVDSEAKVHVLGTVEEAVERARELSGSERVEVLVTGSLHLVGGLVEVLESEKEGERAKL